MSNNDCFTTEQVQKIIDSMENCKNNEDIKETIQPIVLPVIVPNPKCENAELQGGSDTINNETSTLLETETPTITETTETTNTIETDTNELGLFDKIKLTFKDLGKGLFQNGKDKLYFIIWIILSSIQGLWTIFSPYIIKKRRWKGTNLWVIIGLSILGPIGEWIYRKVYIQNILLKNIWDFPNKQDFTIPDSKTSMSYTTKDAIDAERETLKNEKKSFVGKYLLFEKPRSSPRLSSFFKWFTYFFSILLPIIGPIITRRYFISNDNIEDQIIKNHKGKNFTDPNIQLDIVRYIDEKRIDIEGETTIETETPIETLTKTPTETPIETETLTDTHSNDVSA